ncbi:MAG: hypothetical protein V2I51_23745 [Anderseniella sp.]|jgi:hypothetical protein|nr:hypothetical protein [Anderseniella sp.]
MKYLGTLAGGGSILQDGVEITRVQFKFDGYSTSYAGVVCNGEVVMSAEMLKTLFPMRTMQLRTDEGRILELRLSESKLGPGQEAAHVDVRGEIPGNDKRQWLGKRGVDRLPAAGEAAEPSGASRNVSKAATFYSSFGARQAHSRRIEG